MKVLPSRKVSVRCSLFKGILVLLLLSLEQLSLTPELAEASMLPIRWSHSPGRIPVLSEKMSPNLHGSSWPQQRGFVLQRGGGTKNNKAVSKPKNKKKVEEQETDLRVAVRAGISAAIGTVGLVGILGGAHKLCSRFAQQQTPAPWLTRVCSKTIKGLPVGQWASLVFVLFGSTSAVSQRVLKNFDRVPGDAEWYASLRKPWFNPPSWLFPIMWILINKPTQIAALSRVLKSSTSFPLVPLTVYCGHLALGDVWNQVFFERQRIRLGAQIISTFYAALVTSATIFYGIDPVAGKLMLPTVGWVTVATALNWEIDRLNPSPSSPKKN